MTVFVDYLAAKLKNAWVVVNIEYLVLRGDLKKFRAPTPDGWETLYDLTPKGKRKHADRVAKRAAKGH